MRFLCFCFCFCLINNIHPEKNYWVQVFPRHLKSIVKLLSTKAVVLVGVDVSVEDIIFLREFIIAWVNVETCISQFSMPLEKLMAHFMGYFGLVMTAHLVALYLNSGGESRSKWSSTWESWTLRFIQIWITLMRGFCVISDTIAGVLFECPLRYLFNRKICNCVFSMKSDYLQETSSHKDGKKKKINAQVSLPSIKEFSAIG